MPVLIILASLSVKAQYLPCGTDAKVAEAFQNNPSYQQNYNDLRRYADKYLQEHFIPNKGKSSHIYQIPIVFHVIHV